MLGYAESQDSKGVFDSKVVKAFYTSSILFDVLSVLGELDYGIKVGAYEMLIECNKIKMPGIQFCLLF
jgi:hypothetical protein